MGGNVLAQRDGRPWPIDPVAHGGHRERVPLWQLFPLLVHAVLFGGGYLGRRELAGRLSR